MQRFAPTPSAAPSRGLWRWLGLGLHAALIFGALGLYGYATLVYVKQASAPKPAPPPITMDAVDWHSPGSSVFCLSCHRDVGRAAAGFDVEHGHPLNVALNDQQSQAVAQLGTIAGPGNTLICMSCHKLDSKNPHMLADVLTDGALCQHCHTGHYAKGTPHDLRITAPQEKNRLGETVAEGGPCSACHLAHRFARDFASTELDPDGRCITCHQEYRIAAAHARQRIEHPKSRCLECHNPHDVASGEFLKKPEPDLCLDCHKSYGGGLAAGMHPIGNMDRPVPDVLIHAGARTGADPQSITCTTCHAVHEAGHDSLLLLAKNTNELCLACHQEKLVEGNDGTLPRHGQSPVLTTDQQAVVAQWTRPVGPNQELLCISCHRVHTAEDSANLLAFQPHQGDACIACHPNTAAVAGTVHDLTTKFPQARNRAGQTAVSAGACSPCHTAHRFGRDPVPGPGDPSGKCMACHLAGRVGDTKLVGGVAHPKTRCGECHNPHSAQNRMFLAKPEAELCGGCHAAELSLVGGPHDLAQAKHPDKWAPTARATGGLCLPCHVPHGGARNDLFRVGQGDSVGNHDEVCLACHADAGWGVTSGIAAIHPQKISPDEKKVELALVPTDAAGNLRMGCRTCHNPHGGADPVHLARVAPGESTQSLCRHCHADKDYIQYTSHSPEKLAAHGYDVDSCKPCHAMHADKTGVWGQMLSPRFLVDRCDADLGTCLPCQSCHRAGGSAPMRETPPHPQRPMVNLPPDDPGYLPLFDAQGREVQEGGQIVCRTCHLSHGRLDLLKRSASDPTLSPEEQHLMRMQVRAFVTPNTCTVCHGEEARVRFLFFHDVEHRKPTTPAPSLPQ